MVETIYADDTPNVDSDNPRSRSEYYQDGMIKADIDERGNRTEYVYDAARRLVKSESDCGCRRKTYIYNVVGKKISETDPLGHTTSYIYNGLNRVIETRFADNSYTTSNYDANGREIASTNPNGNITEYRYDSLGRLTGVKDTLNNWTEYGYNEIGNLLWIEDAEDNRTHYEYNLLGQRIAVILPLGQRSTSSYDAVGNIETDTDFNGNIIAYRYDERNRLKEKSLQNNHNISYSYTAIGQRKSVRNGDNITLYSYDERNRLISRIDPDGTTISYTYDAAGNKTSVTTPNGTTTYTYDRYNQLETVTDAEAGLTRYLYDSAGNLVKTELPNGTAEIREYDLLNRLVKLENILVGEETNTSISSYNYSYDSRGNRIKVVEGDGRVVEYVYDDLSRVIKEKIVDTTRGNLVYEYVYDSAGNRQQKTESVNGVVTNTSYIYDNNDLLISESSNGIVTNYSYDSNGNTITKTNSTEEIVYEWDYEGRLVGVSINDGVTEITYGYNVDGIRVSSRLNGEETRYLIDTEHPYDQVVEEYTNEGTILTSYVYGNNLISRQQGDNTVYYHVDGLGSTTNLTNSLGAVVDSYSYEAFGEVLNSTGNVGNKYLFAGEQYDSVLDAYYLRARYYSPEMGRFISRDSFEGSLYEPLSLHKYLYAHGNPVMFVDPSGLATLSEITAARKIRDTLASAETTTFEKFVSTGGNPSAFVTESAWKLGFDAFPYVRQLLSKIGNFKVSSGQRIELYREALNLTSKTRRRQNFAFADVYIGKEKATLLSLSGQDYRVELVSPYPYPKQFFNPFPVEHTRSFDSEYKILETIANRYVDNRYVEGTIHLYTERLPCASCGQVIRDFKRMFPNIELTVLSG